MRSLSSISRRRSIVLRWTLLVFLTAGYAGCDAFNPAFTDIFDPEGTGAFSTLDNAPGHVVVAFVNDATVDERLLGFLETQSGLNHDAAERAALRPRVRLRVLITFSDNTEHVIEFVDGSPELIDPAFDAQAFPDLQQNDLNNVVVICDVSSVVVEPGSVEVFIPVELLGFELDRSTATGGDIVTGFEIRERIPPNFTPLLVDQVDENLNLIVQQNIGIRDVPSPALSPRCGSVIPIVLSGTLSVPFSDFTAALDVPGFDREDQRSVGTIGGRYRFRVDIR